MAVIAFGFYRNKILWFLLILAIAAFFRFYQLDSIPPGLYPDVAINGNEALSNPGHVFYPENNGREGLMINLIALSFSLFGISVWSIKAVAAFFGTLTVLGTHLLCKELFPTNLSPLQKNSEINLRDHSQKLERGKTPQWSTSEAVWHGSEQGEDKPPRDEQQFLAGKLIASPCGVFPSVVPLLASFFLAISFWHVNFSRFGFRAILLPFVLVFAFYFLFRGFRLKKLLDVILAGIIFGLGFYTYTSFRVAVLLLPLPIISFWLFSRKENWQRKFFIYKLVFFAVIFFVALPIGLYFLAHPADFASRAAPLSVFTQENPVKAFLISFGRHLIMFNIFGDSNWRHNYPGSPQLLWPVGILFMIGIIASLRNIIQDLRNDLRDHPEASGHGVPPRRDERAEDLSKRTRWVSARVPQIIFLNPYSFLLSWLFVMLLPGALTYEGMPHSLRTIGVIPVPYIFAAIGGWQLWQWLLRKNIHRKLLVFFAFFFLAMLAFAEYNKYFILWGKNKEVEGAFTKSYVEVGNYLNSLPEGTKKYVIVNEGGVAVPFPDGLAMPAQTVMFIERTKYGVPTTTYLEPKELDKIKEGPAIIVSMKYEEQLFTALQNRFPQGAIETENKITVFKKPF